MSVEAVANALPYLIPRINKAIVQTVELEDHCYSMHAKGEAKDMNSLGARVVLKLQVNPFWGSSGEGEAFREPGRHVAKQAVIGWTGANIAHGVSGSYFENVEGTDAIGGKLASLMKDNVLYHKKQMDIDFCLGTGTGHRGTVLTADSATQATFTSEFGTRLLKGTEGETYFFHHPTTGAIHGETDGHTLTSITSTTVAVFETDITSGTTVAANDIIVHKGSADGISSWNRAIFGYEHFFLDSADYFGLDKDTDTNLQGIRINGSSAMVSFSLLEKGITTWMYRWNNEAPSTLIDVIPPAQSAAYKLLGYSLRRITGQDRKFDGGITKVSDGDRDLYIDANIRPSNWFRYDRTTIERYEFKPFGIWDKDGLRMRTSYSNGSITDTVFWVMNGKEQMFCNNPARSIWTYSLGTTGVATGV